MPRPPPGERGAAAVRSTARFPWTVRIRVAVARTTMLRPGRRAREGKAPRCRPTCPPRRWIDARSSSLFLETHPLHHEDHGNHASFHGHDRPAGARAPAPPGPVAVSMVSKGPDHPAAGRRSVGRGTSPARGRGLCSAYVRRYEDLPRCMHRAGRKYEDQPRSCPDVCAAASESMKIGPDVSSAYVSTYEARGRRGLAKMISSAMGATTMKPAGAGGWRGAPTGNACPLELTCRQSDADMRAERR
jgi:hypothetical protein